MDYQTALDALFQPAPEGSPAPRTDARAAPARRLRDAIEPLAMADLWGRHGYDRFAALGLDFLTGYVWGRAAALGEPPATLVAATFAVFEPVLIAGLYESAVTTCSRADVLSAREAASIDTLRDALGSPTGVGDVVARLRRGLAAADPTGRPLYAGLTSLPWPDEPLGALWHACDMLRELRGDGHIAACVAAGLDPVEMNVLTELYAGWEPLAYTATRGWPQEVMDAALARLREGGLVGGGTLTPQGEQLRDGIEDTTDRTMQPVVDALGADLPALVDQLSGWSEAVVSRGSFPPDPRKRAAG